MATPRQVVGLEWAEPAQSPWPTRRAPRAASKAAGLRYQRSVAKIMPNAQADLWFHFCDANGPGYCSPDIILPQLGLCLECKLTHWPGQEWQLKGLYLPVLREVWPQHEWRGLLVCKNLSRGTDITLVEESFAGALATLAEHPEQIPILHMPRPQYPSHRGRFLHR